MIIPRKSIPANVKPGIIENGKFIIAHSETGHHHVIDAPRAEVYEAADDSFVAYIKTLGDGAEITHERSFDTHETISLEPNSFYEVRRQREYVPQGFRKAAD
jgi:hypothetical protein